VTKRLENESFMSERVLKIPVFLTSSGPSTLERGRAQEQQHHLIAVSIQFEYDPDELATKITT